MKKSIKYKPFESFVLRLPSRSMTEYFEKANFFHDSLTSIDGKMLDAIFLASPILFREIERFNSGGLKVDKRRKFMHSLLKYYIRMSTRCTPLGLFAGCSTGKIDSSSKCVVRQSDRQRIHTRLDMNFLCSLIETIGKFEEVREQTNYFPNSSLYRSGENLRYTEYFYHNSKRKYRLSEIENSIYLNLILTSANKGLSKNGLCYLLVDNGIEFEEANEFIEQLIDEQVLVSEISAAVTGEEPLQKLIFDLGKLERIDGVLLHLKNLSRMLSKIDNSSDGKRTEKYVETTQYIKENFAVPFNEKYLFHTDLFVETESTLSKKIVQDVERGLSVLNRLSTTSENPNIEKFKKDFYARYEDEEIPLCEALDIETGVGFANFDSQSMDVAPLLKGVCIPMSPKVQKNVNYHLSRTQRLLIHKYEEFISDSLKTEIEIKDEDLSDFSERWDDLPDTFSAMIELVSIQDGSEDGLLILRQAGNSSAAALLGRFCYLDGRINSIVEQVVEKEREFASGKILAEIAHLPETRTGNVLMRPTIREYEIPYLANCSVDTEHVLPITDLMVSVRGGNEIVLRSKRLNKEILPRLASAHSFSKNSLPIYHFLGTLQFQNKRGGIGFNWGPILSDKPYLPRVRYRNVILSPATWKISSKDAERLPHFDDDNFFEKLDEFRRFKNIPRLVNLVYQDNKLLIDFTHKLSCKMFISEVKRVGFKLEEFVFDFQNAYANQESKAFANEIVLNFYKD